MEKNLEHYLGLPYTRELIPEPGGIWFVRIKELPNCMSQGNSPEEAIQNIDDAMYGWIKGELEDGEVIPEPKEEEEYSGKFNLRVPRSLHRKLVETADSEDVSLNAFCASALAEAVGVVKVAASQENESQRDRAVRSLLESENINLQDRELNACLSDWLRREVGNAVKDLREGASSRGTHQLYAVSRDLKRMRKLDPVLEAFGDLLDLMQTFVEVPSEYAMKVTGVSSVVAQYGAASSQEIQVSREKQYTPVESAKPTPTEKPGVPVETKHHE